MTSHLPIERLTAYRAGELPPEEADAVQDHLVACRACAATLLEIPRFEEAMEADVPATPERTEASWQALRARLPLPAVPSQGGIGANFEAGHPEGEERAGRIWGQESSARPDPSTRPSRQDDSRTVSLQPTSAPMGRRGEGRFRRSTIPPAVTYALAAALAGCLVGFSSWIATHRAPGPSPSVLTTAAGAEVTRGADNDEPIEVASTAGLAVLILPLPEGPPFPSYRVEILTAAGDLRLTVETDPTAVAAPPHTAAAPQPLLTIALPPERLPAGEYRLRILGLRDGHGEALAEHPLRKHG